MTPPAPHERKKTVRLSRRIALSLIATLSSCVAPFHPIFHALPAAAENAPSPRDHVFISRVGIHGDSADEDFVEIQNGNDCAISLSGWKLMKRSASGKTESSIKSFGATTVIRAHGTLLWANSAHGFSKRLNAHEESAATLAPHNSLGLIDNRDTLVDSLSWGIVSSPFDSTAPASENPEAHASINRSSKKSEASTEIRPLPRGDLQQEAPTDLCGQSRDRAQTSSLVISEILANPRGDEAEGEFIELENRGDRTIDLSGWTMRDGSKTGRYAFPEGRSIEPSAFLTLSRQDVGFSLNNGEESVTLSDPENEAADTVSWKNTRENISVARDGARFRPTKFVTRGGANRFGNDPSARVAIPKKGFVGIPLSFSAQTTDLDHDPVKVAWNFGDGRKSYSPRTRHTFAKKGRFSVTLTATDGVSDTIQTFHVNIKNTRRQKFASRELFRILTVPTPARNTSS